LHFSISAKSMRGIPVVGGVRLDLKGTESETAGSGASPMTFLTTGRVFSTSALGTSKTS